MGDKSSIEWTDATWNPVRGCTRVSEGCRNCYAEIMAARFSKPGQWGHGFAEMRGGDHRWTGKVELVEAMLDLPLRWKKARRIFVNSTSDLFHEALAEEKIAEVFGVMAVAGNAHGFHGPRDGHTPAGSWTASDGKNHKLKWPTSGHGPHVFQILTKRPDRMARLMNLPRFRRDVSHAAYRWAHNRVTAGALSDSIERGDGWPLPNVWLGTSVEDQAAADARVPHLLATPAALRFLSCEPLIGPLDLRRWMRIAWQCSYCRSYFSGAHKPSCPDCGSLGGWSGSHAFNGRQARHSDVGSGIDWGIAGGESGPGSRPFRYSWAASLAAQCRTAGIPFFMKQVGSQPIDDLGYAEISHDANLRSSKGGDLEEWPRELRVREFPGVAHKAFPAALAG